MPAHSHPRSRPARRELHHSGRPNVGALPLRGHHAAALGHGFSADAIAPEHIAGGRLLKSTSPAGPARRRRAGRARRLMPTTLLPATLPSLPAETPGTPPLASHQIPAASPEPVLVYVEPGPDWLSFVAPSRRSDAYYLLVTLALLGLLLLGR